MTDVALSFGYPVAAEWHCERERGEFQRKTRQFFRVAGHEPGKESQLRTDQEKFPVVRRLHGQNSTETTMELSFPKRKRNFRSAREVTEALGDVLCRAFKNDKAAARAADSNTRSAKNWRAKKNLPGARNLIALMAESDEVCFEVLRLAGRMTEAQQHEIELKLKQIEKILER